MTFSKVTGGATYYTQNGAFHQLGYLGIEWEQAQGLILQAIEVHRVSSRSGKYVPFTVYEEHYFIRYHRQLGMWSIAHGSIPDDVLAPE